MNFITLLKVHSFNILHKPFTLVIGLSFSLSAVNTEWIGKISGINVRMLETIFLH